MTASDSRESITSALTRTDREGSRGRRNRPRLPRQMQGDTQLRVASVVLFLIAWQAVAAPMNPLLLPTPFAVLRALFDLITTGTLLGGLADSVLELAIGFGLAMAIGIGVGILMGRYRRVEVVLDPYVNFMNATPLVAIIPLIIIWLGVEFGARVVVVTMIGVWPILQIGRASCRERVLRLV